MITWLFDQRNKWGPVPNLIHNANIQPGTTEWWDLCVQPPYSYEFRFLKYCSLDKVNYRTELVSGIWQAPAYYPINLNFWDPTIDYFSLMNPDSLERLKRGDFRVLFYYSEGDDPEIEIRDHLNSLVLKHGINIDNVKVVIANWLVEPDPTFFYFPDDELYYRYLNITKGENRDWVQDINISKRDYKSTCLIRANKVWRKVFASIFVNLGLNKDCQFSYNNYSYETPAIEQDTIRYWSKLDDNILSVISSFELNLPYKCDSLTDNEHNNHKLINREFYDNSYWNIVVETHFNQNTIFLTEKTFKPILNLQPFIIVGNTHSLKLLRHLGYKTFENVLQEKYDNITNSIDRMHNLLEACYSLDARTHKDHISMIKLVSDTLFYNQEHFLAPKVGRIKNLLNQLEY